MNKQTSRAALTTGQAVTLVGGGALDDRDLETAMALAPVLAAADSGAGALLARGHMPEAVFGDFDSIAESDAARIPPGRLFRVEEQDSTDFHKALSRIEAPLVLAVGFLGARVDHQLAVLNTLVQVNRPPCLLLGPHEVIFHLPPAFALDMVAGETVSLFPLLPVAGRSEGLEWPIDGLAFAPGGQIGTSNRALGPVRIEMEGPGMIALLPRRHVEGVIAALTLPGDGA